MLAELASVDEDRRMELVVGWTMDGIADMRGVVLEAQSRGGGDASEELEGLGARRASVERFAAEKGVGTRRWKLDEKKLADEHGRGDEYIAFRLTHHFVHGSTMAVSQRYSKGDDDTVLVGGHAAALEVWAPDAGLFGAISLLHACRAVCRTFEWPEPPELAGLLARTEQLATERRSAQRLPD
ncbi:MAG TPA: hypothetical protein VK506_05040 [Conexibacter sp.]|nr:hypothetical protein [Conexibacter sp.]